MTRRAATAPIAKPPKLAPEILTPAPVYGTTELVGRAAQDVPYEVPMDVGYTGAGALVEPAPTAGTVATVDVAATLLGPPAARPV